MYLTNMFAGSNIYTFEIEYSSDGKRHLIITEEKQSSIEEKSEVAIAVSEEYLTIFTEMLNTATRFMIEHKASEAAFAKTSSGIVSTNEAKANQKSYSVEEKRKEHSKAYAKWTQDEDDKLKKLFAEGRTAKELAEIFQRNRGAITSRLAKLGLT